MLNKYIFRRRWIFINEKQWNKRRKYLATEFIWSFLNEFNLLRWKLLQFNHFPRKTNNAAKPEIESRKFLLKLQREMSSTQWWQSRVFGFHTYVIRSHWTAFSFFSVFSLSIFFGFFILYGSCNVLRYTVRCGPIACVDRVQCMMIAECRKEKARLSHAMRCTVFVNCMCGRMPQINEDGEPVENTVAIRQSCIDCWSSQSCTVFKTLFHSVVFFVCVRVHINTTT